MPAPQALAFLPKPILFGLYGAIGGLLGALVFAEPAWQILKPPPPPPSAEPEPQVAVSASKDFQLILDKANSFAVEIARSGFDGPVDIKVENLPAGVEADPLTISKGTSGSVNMRASGSASPGSGPIKVVATAAVKGKTIRSETTQSFELVAPPAPQADVFFVLDVTGSMGWAIDGIRNGIGGFAAKMREQKIDFRIGLLAFRDITIDPVPMDLFKFGGDVFTTDVTAFRNQVGRLVSMGGGDEPESSLEAVEMACQQPFRKGATKVLLLITDAPPKVKPRQNVPQTFAEELDGAKKIAVVIRDKEIDAVHLVVRPDDLPIYTPIMEAGAIKGGGRSFDLKETVNRREAGFTTLLNTFTSAVAEAAKAKNPVTPVVAAQAEKPVLTARSLQSSEKFAEGSQGTLLLMSAVWAGAIAALVCLTLLSGQHHYLKGGLPPVGPVAAGLLGGLLAGLLGGACGYGLYLLSPSGAFIESLFRVLGWALLGGLAGVGLSLFIPNLKWTLGLAGGALGGAVGAIGFIVATLAIGLVIGGSAGDIIGRLSGGLIMGFCIGLMVAIVEAAFRSAWLEVRYGARETITVNLGPEPVKIGGDNRACTVWARGAPPVALRYFIRGGKVICEDAPNRNEAVVQGGDQREVGNVTVTVRTGSGKSPSTGLRARPNAAPTPPRKAASQKAQSQPLELDDEPAPPPPPVVKPLELGPFDDDEPLPLPESKPAATAAPKPIAPPPWSPAPTVFPPKPPSPATTAKPPVPAPSAKPPAPPPSAPAAKPAAPKPPPAPRDPDSCPSCGRKNPGRPGSRYCMMCDQTY